MKYEFDEIFSGYQTRQDQEDFIEFSHCESSRMVSI